MSLAGGWNLEGPGALACPSCTPAVCFKAQTYREHAKARFGLQLPLFDEDDGAIGNESGTL